MNTRSACVVAGAARIAARTCPCDPHWRMISQNVGRANSHTDRACGMDGQGMATRRRDALSLALAVLGAMVMAAMPARAADESAAAFFQGKQVRFYTMGSPGGGYDTYMRALVPHLEKKLGARMLPTNEPGAGGLIAVNRTINAPPDGLTILLVGGETLATAQLYESPGVNYDVRKLTWLARLSSEAKVALLGPKSPYRSVLDLAASETPVTWAGSSKIDGNTDFTALMAYALGMKAK